MKRVLVATLLSLFVLSQPVQAASLPEEPIEGEIAVETEEEKVVADVTEIENVVPEKEDEVDTYGDQCDPESIETTESPKEEPKEDSPKESDVSQTEWDFSKSLTNSVSYTASDAVTRLEAFYSAGAPAPTLTISSGGNISVEQIENNDVPGYDKVKYDIYYVTGEAGNPVNVDIAIDQYEGEFVLALSEVPDGYKELTAQYKTQPTEVLSWGLSELASYTVGDISAIIAKEANPGINQISSVTPDEPQPVDPRVSKLLLSAIFFTIGSILLVLNALTKAKREEAQKERAIKNANRRVKEKKKKEDAELEDLIDRVNAGEDFETASVENEKLEPTTDFKNEEVEEDKISEDINDETMGEAQEDTTVNAQQEEKQKLDAALTAEVESEPEINSDNILASLLGDLPEEKEVPHLSAVPAESLSSIKDFAPEQKKVPQETIPFVQKVPVYAMPAQPVLKATGTESVPSWMQGSSGQTAEEDDFL